MRYVLTFCLTLLLILGQPHGANAGSKPEDLTARALAPVNAIRKQHGLGQLGASRKLTSAAAAHASDMETRGFFSHTGSNGSTLGQRVRKQRYRFCAVAENIAKGQGSLEDVLAGWMASPGHRRNMLNPDVSEFSLVRGGGNVWVMVLGRSGC